MWRSYPMVPEDKALLGILACIPLRDARLWRRAYEVLTLHGRESVIDVFLPRAIEEVLSR